MANRGEAGCVQLLVVRDPIGELLIGRAWRGRRQPHERLRGVDQLAVQAAIRITRDAAAGRLRRFRRDAPPRQRGGIEDVFVSAPDQDHRIVWRHLVEIVTQGEALFLQLRLVPVAVGKNHVAGLRLPDARVDGRRHVSQRACPRQIDAGTATCAMQVVVHQPRDDGVALQIDDAG